MKLAIDINMNQDHDHQKEQMHRHYDHQDITKQALFNFCINFPFIQPWLQMELIVN